MTNRQSPATSAQALWGLENPPPNDELPALKSSSDIMWGLWNLASPNNVGGIKYILSTPIINDETVAIIKKILQDNCLDLDEIMIWSGCEFGSDDPEYLALLGKLYLGSTFWGWIADFDCECRITEWTSRWVLPGAAQSPARRKICVKDQYLQGR